MHGSGEYENEATGRKDRMPEERGGGGHSERSGDDHSESGGSGYSVSDRNRHNERGRSGYSKIGRNEHSEIGENGHNEEKIFDRRRADKI